MQIPLTPRLENIISHVKGPTAADIGTDHAYVSIELIRSGICSHVIASDIKPGPVAIAKANTEKYGLCGKIDIRLGSGISVLEPGETDDIIIAGMGGEVICQILRENELTAKASRLILQPMNSQYELRHFLIENGWKIEDEDISLEGFKVYNLITAQKGSQPPFALDIYYHLPPYLTAHRYFQELYSKKKRELVRVIDGLEHSKEPDYEKLKKYKQWLKELVLYENN